jgi:hypothetical protein
MAHRRHSRKSHRKASRKAHRKSHRKVHRKSRSQRGGQCAAVPLQNAVFAQRGGMAPFEAGGNDLFLDKATMVQAQSYDQLGMIQEAGRIAAAAQHGGRRRSRRQRKSRKQRGGMSPFDADPMLLPKSAYAFAGFNPQFSTEASVQPALRMGAGPQAA